MTENTQNYCSMPIDPTLVQKICRRLFPRQHCDFPYLKVVQHGSMVTIVDAYISWNDRIRILISGKAMIEIKTSCQNDPGIIDSSSSFSVRPPKWIEIRS